MTSAIGHLSHKKLSKNSESHTNPTTISNEFKTAQSLYRLGNGYLRHQQVRHKSNHHIPRLYNYPSVKFSQVDSSPVSGAKSSIIPMRLSLPEQGRSIPVHKDYFNKNLLLDTGTKSRFQPTRNAIIKVNITDSHISLSLNVPKSPYYDGKK